MKIKVSELIVRYMEHLGIDTIFGMPGAHILPVYDALYDSNIEAVLAKHEQGAAFMAGGHAKTSAKVSACIATAGPGATNLITGIANAYADKQPVLVITGEAPTYLYGKGGLQESSGEGGSFDQVALFSHITRYCKSIERVDYLAQVLNQATKALMDRTPGPVLISIPFNVQNELVEEAVLQQLTYKTAPASDSPSSESSHRFLQLLQEAEHPVIVAGYGALRSGAQQAISTLSSRFNIPVASSLKGKGIVAEQNDLSLGSLGVTSNGVAYQYIKEEADLLIVLGASFNERTSYLWDDSLLGHLKIIQVDLNAQQLDKVFSADLSICGDIRTTLEHLLKLHSGENQQQLQQQTPESSITQLKALSDNGYAIFKSGFSLVEAFYQKLSTEFDEAIRVFDDNIIFAQNFYEVPANHYYHPNAGISSLGHAIPAAIGAQFTNLLPTFAVLGDGGFQMCCMEIMTAVNYNKPLNVVIFNNGTMGLIRKNQFQLYEKRFINCDFTNPDYQQLALSFGINYQRITDTDDLDELFKTQDLRHAINLIDIAIDKDAFPNYSSKR
ncbi:MAG: thiamine pyrophosphate-binding protein [Chromatiales bacterium]|nr:thiamine pyrophosphate-binding protein [Chromatiales bacterium]